MAAFERLKETIVEPSEERIRIWHPDGHEHKLIVQFSSGSFEASIEAKYDGGCSNIEAWALVASWPVDYVPPTPFDRGHVWFGGGRIDIEIRELRGIGLGSLLMLPLVRWAKNRPGDVPVVPISLQGPDAKIEGEGERRNRFYEKLGFVFDFDDQERTYGDAQDMLVSELVTPTFKMSRGWQVESLSGTGNVFKPDIAEIPL